MELKANKWFKSLTERKQGDTRVALGCFPFVLCPVARVGLLEPLSPYQFFANPYIYKSYLSFKASFNVLIVFP